MALKENAALFQPDGRLCSAHCMTQMFPPAEEPQVTLEVQSNRASTSLMHRMKVPAYTFLDKVFLHK